ncbi:LysE family translocator [Oleidesulfovibrio sp.]|uniref:LysE family translocator n=1 Tax=Oleidesulfovibrio sp. TaxID=2909707 RepID=UPI003A899CDA
MFLASAFADVINLLPEMAMLAGVALVLTVTPGPDTFLVLRNALTGGAGCGRQTACGIASGLLFHATLAGLGLSAVLVHSAQAYSLVRWCGAAYLVWLGIKALYGVWRAGGLRETVHETARACTPVSDGNSEQCDSLAGKLPTSGTKHSAFREGLITNILNPKVAVFYLAVLPQVMGASPEAWRAVWFAFMHVAVTICWFFLLSKGCGRAGAVLRPVVMRLLDALAGGLMLAFGLRLAFDQGR